MSEEYGVGKETDALVAETVMGWPRCSVAVVPERGFPQYAIGEHDVFVFWAAGVAGSPWSPSADISAAWEVVEKHAGNWRLHQRTNGKWDVAVSGEIAVADTAPLAICRVALRAIAYITSSASQEGP